MAIDAVRAGAEDYIVKGATDGPTFGRVIRYAIERKKREPTEEEPSEEYERTEDLYRRIVEFSQGLICTHDLDGTLLSVNPAAAIAFGWQSRTIGACRRISTSSPGRSFASVARWRAAGEAEKLNPEREEGEGRQPVLSHIVAGHVRHARRQMRIRRLVCQRPAGIPVLH